MSPGDLLPWLSLPTGGGIGWFFKTWFGRADKREAGLMRREKEYQDRIDKQLAKFEERFARIERSNAVLVGVLHVVIDDLDPDNGTLAAIKTLLNAAFPPPEETPSELLQLIARLDAKEKRRKRV